MPETTPAITIESQPDSFWICLCGNTHDLDGFLPSDTAGDPMEPDEVDEHDAATLLYLCQRCLLIIDASTYSPISGTVTAVPHTMAMLVHHDSQVTTAADLARAREAGRLRLAFEGTREHVLLGDVVEFGDGVRFRLGDDGDGLFATPIAWPASDFRLTEHGRIHNRAARIDTDVPVDPGELRYTELHQRVSSHYQPAGTGTRIDFDHRARVWRTDRVCPTATLHQLATQYLRRSPAQAGADVNREALELFNGLDHALRAGGELPSVWADARPPAGHTARAILSDRLAKVYAEELAALISAFGGAYVEHLGGGVAGLAIPVGTYTINSPIPGEIIIRSAEIGLADTREEILHWVAKLYIQEQPVGIGHSLDSATDAALQALLHYRRNGDQVVDPTCPCEMAAHGDSDPFTDTELSRIHAEYKTELRARAEAGADTSHAATDDALTEAITVRNGMIVITNIYGVGRTIQFLRSPDRDRILAYDTDRCTEIGQWHQADLTPDLITAACAILRS